MDADSVDPTLALDARYVPLGSFCSVIAEPCDGILASLTADWSSVSRDVVLQAVPEWATELAQLIGSNWIRVLAKLDRNSCRVYLSLRVFLLPDDVGRSKVERTAGKTRTCLRTILGNINRSPSAWQDPYLYRHDFLGYASSAPEDDSLFYIFNTLPSPPPQPNATEDNLVAARILDILDDHEGSNGLKTVLYDYQRRSIATMVQKETLPVLERDHRLETCIGPTGQSFFLDRDKCEILSEARLYQTVRGGILAETMGYGKTLICLATILTTKGQLPEHPLDRRVVFPDLPSSSSTLSLSSICAHKIAEDGLQWRAYFEAQGACGRYFDRCVEMLDSTISRYSVEVPKRKRSRGSKQAPEMETVYLASTTLIVVPPNLLEQWRREIRKHLGADALSVLVLEDAKTTMPPSLELRSYDVILIAGTRFEAELVPANLDPFAHNVRACVCEGQTENRLCSLHPYKSPLRDIHFLRIIVDEGQRFISGSTTRAIQGLKAIKVERKWLVSGTPAGSMIGAEVETAAKESHEGIEDPIDTDEQLTDIPSSGTVKFKEDLSTRRLTTDPLEERRSIERLGHIARSFLCVQPWANDDEPTSWNTYVVPRKDGERKSISLRNVLTSLVVRHQYEDVVSDLDLPPLTNKLVHLRPCYHDKLSINLFILALGSNAVTSERTDQDYMFHPRNRKYLETLIRNLRHAGFTWSGFKADDIKATCDLSHNFLKDPHKFISAEDRRNLQASLAHGELALGSSTWRAFHDRGEMGLYLSDFPLTQKDAWSLVPEANRHTKAHLMTSKQIYDAQNLVETHLYASNFAAMIKHLELGEHKDVSKPLRPLIATDAPLSKGMPQSGLQETRRLTAAQFSSLGSGVARSEQHNSRKSTAMAAIPIRNTGKVSVRPIDHRNAASSPIKGRGQLARSMDSPTVESRCIEAVPTLVPILKNVTRSPEIPPAYPEISRTKLVGTSSAKLSYLIDRILVLHQREKILVFYEGDDIAYYCAQALELLNIPHLIYASGIKQDLRNDYQTSFNTDEHFRVLLMDLKQAALGLHMASASRVFFINPVWQPSIEAQAIKRAHRIGQTRPVFVETLVLKDTIEDAMLQRRKDMTVAEHHKAARSLLDDDRMKALIQQAKVLPITDEERNNPEKQFAPLENAWQVFARSILDHYGDAETVLHHWRRIHGCAGNNKNVKHCATDPKDVPIAEVPSESAQHRATSQSSSGASRKRKALFVDELEMRKRSREFTEDVRMASSPADIMRDPETLALPRRRVRFSDEGHRSVGTGTL